MKLGVAKISESGAAEQSMTTLESLLIGILRPHMMSGIDRKKLIWLEQLLTSAVHEWSFRNDMDMSHWCVRLLLLGVSGEPQEMVYRILNEFDVPQVVCGTPRLETGQVTVMLVDPSGIWTEPACVERMMRTATEVEGEWLMVSYSEEKSREAFNRPVTMCETGCGEKASFRSHKGYELCRTCYVERRVGEVEPEVQAYRGRQPNPAALPTREQVEAVLPEGWSMRTWVPGNHMWDRRSSGHVLALWDTHRFHPTNVPHGSEHRALDIIRERVAEVTGRPIDDLMSELRSELMRIMPNGYGCVVGWIGGNGGVTVGIYKGHDLKNIVGGVVVTDPGTSVVLSVEAELRRLGLIPREEFRDKRDTEPAPPSDQRDANSMDPEVKDGILHFWLYAGTYTGREILGAAQCAFKELCGRIEPGLRLLDVSPLGQLASKRVPGPEDTVECAYSLFVRCAIDQPKRTCKSATLETIFGINPRCSSCNAPVPRGRRICVDESLNEITCVYCDRRMTSAEPSDQRTAAEQVDSDPVDEWSVFESPTWEE